MAGQPTTFYISDFFTDAVSTDIGMAFIALSITFIGITGLFAVIIVRKHNRISRFKAHAAQQLIANTVASQEEERQRIASVIHDSFCSRLSIIKLMLHNTAPEKELSGEIFTRIDEAYQEARILSHQLDSPVLERMGFLDALRDYIRPLYDILNIEVHVLQVFTQRLAKNIELHLFRILQEAITNIIRHANASAIQIDIHFSRQFAALRITDNGVGFNTKNKPEGAGLKNIKIRLAILQGSYRIRSQPQQGTSLLVSIPIEHVPDRKLALSPNINDDAFDHEDANIYLNAKKQFLYAKGARFILSTRRRRAPLYRRYRKHHSSKNKAQDTL